MEPRAEYRAHFARRLWGQRRNLDYFEMAPRSERLWDFAPALRLPTHHRRCSGPRSKARTRKLAAAYEGSPQNYDLRTQAQTHLLSMTCEISSMAKLGLSVRKHAGLVLPLNGGAQKT